MTVAQRMRAQLKDAMKAKDAVRTQFLRYWIAQFTLGDGSELPDDQAVKKMRGVLNEAKSGLTTFSAQEIELIREWVPATLTPDQIAEALAAIADQIKAAPKDGMAMGLAMKHLAGKPVESEHVRDAVAALRRV